MTGNTKQLDTTSFTKHALQSDRPVLVDFYADWCPPCRVLGPTIDALADDYAGAATIAKVDVDANGPLAERYDVSSIPTILLFVDGQVTQRFVGITAREDLARALDDAIRAEAA